jgi:hypothetical protein
MIALTLTAPVIGLALMLVLQRLEERVIPADPSSSHRTDRPELRDEPAALRPTRLGVGTRGVPAPDHEAPVPPVTARGAWHRHAPRVCAPRGADTRDP